MSGPARRRTVTLLVAVSVSFAACGGGRPRALPRVNLITGSTGGDWYRIGSALAEMTNEKFEGRPVTAVPGAGGVSNPARIGRMPGDMGVSFGPFLDAAYLGRPPYREAYPHLRHVATLLTMKLHFIVADRPDLTSLERMLAERRPLRIGTGPPGSAEEFLLRETLAALGSGYDDLAAGGGRVDLLGSAERADVFRDRHVDAIVFNMIQGGPVVTELMLAQPARLLEIPAAARAKLAQSWGVEETVIPAGMYAGQDAPVTTVAINFGIFASDDVPEAVVHELTRTIAERTSRLEKVHPSFTDWDPRQMPRGSTVPLHPGAARYYQERGWPTN
jgi:TRAP transporter TAXI family solute receptor